MYVPSNAPIDRLKNYDQFLGPIFLFDEFFFKGWIVSLANESQQDGVEVAVTEMLKILEDCGGVAKIDDDLFRVNPELAPALEISPASLPHFSAYKEAFFELMGEVAATNVTLLPVGDFESSKLCVERALAELDAENWQDRRKVLDSMFLTTFYRNDFEKVESLCFEICKNSGSIWEIRIDRTHKVKAERYRHANSASPTWSFAKSNSFGYVSTESTRFAGWRLLFDARARCLVAIRL